MLKKIAAAGAKVVYWSSMAILYFMGIVTGLVGEARAFAAEKPLNGLGLFSLVVLYSLFAVGILAELNGKGESI